MDLPTTFYVVFEAGRIRYLLEGPEGKDMTKEFLRWYELSDWKRSLDSESYLGFGEGGERIKISYSQLLQHFVAYLVEVQLWKVHTYQIADL